MPRALRGAALAAECVALLAVAASCADTGDRTDAAGQTDPATREAPAAVRVATFNIQELSTGKLTAVDADGRGLDPQAAAAAAIISRVRPVILLLNEIDLDWDHPDDPALNARRFADAYLAFAPEPIEYPYAYAAPSNTGLLSGLDLNGDGVTATDADRGTREHGDDSYGFGTYPGQFAMAVLSRFPLDTDGARTFQRFRWSDLPGQHVPTGYFTAGVEAAFRLSSKSHWDLPVAIGPDTLHLWASHPTPPVFDGPEDKNGRRNFDEIRFWELYLDGDESLVDDTGKRGGYASGAPFVIAGDMNARPGDEEVVYDGVAAIDQLLGDPRVQDPPGTRRNTAFFTDGVRVDYVLPSSDVEVIRGGVFDPDREEDPEGAGWAEAASDHRLVWVDVAWPPEAGPVLPGRRSRESDAEDAELELGSVVFFHPDGMGVNTWGAVRMMTVGPDGRLNWDELPYMAVYTGHMTDRLTSTSHGGATTHAYGVKVLADSYGMDGREPLTAASGFKGSILQEAKAAGLAVGMVNSGTITEPGSGAFGASVPQRSQHEEIARQIFESGAEVILGGGEKYFLPEGAEGLYGPGVRKDGRNLVAEAVERGYMIVRTRAELLAIPDTATRVLGLFAAYHTFNDLPEEQLREEGLEAWPAEAPTMAEMVQASLDVLSRSDRRFFLVAEEEGSDNMANANNAMGEIQAGQRADEAIGVIRTFISNHPRTLMVMTSDSDAAGMQVLGEPFPSDTAPHRGRNGAPFDGVEGTGGKLFVAQPDASGARHSFVITWAEYRDLSGGILMKAEGLGADQIHGTMDNTEAYRVMYSVLFGPLRGTQ